MVTMALSCIVCVIQRLIGRKSQKFYTPPAFSAPREGRLCRNFAKTFDFHKTRMIGLTCGEKNCNNILSRFHRTLERNGQTNGQTDKFAISISRVNVLTRDKNPVHIDQCMKLQQKPTKVIIVIEFLFFFRHNIGNSDFLVPKIRQLITLLIFKIF